MYWSANLIPLATMSAFQVTSGTDFAGTIRPRTDRLGIIGPGDCRFRLNSPTHSWPPVSSATSNPAPVAPSRSATSILTRSHASRLRFTSFSPSARREIEYCITLSPCGRSSSRRLVSSSARCLGAELRSDRGRSTSSSRSWQASCSPAQLRRSRAQALRR